MVAELDELVFHLFESVALFYVVVQRVLAREPVEGFVYRLQLFVDGGVLGVVARGLNRVAGDSDARDHTTD